VADQNSLNDFEEGARRALEWLGRSEDAAELPQIVGEMPTKLGDMEAAFLIAIARAALAGHKAAPQTETEATARPVTLPPMPEAAPLPTIDVDDFRRRRRERERAARLDELGRRNQEAFMEQGRAIRPGDRLSRDADWGGW
jgi:hypothetical protein